MFHVVTSGRCWLEVDGAERAAARSPATSRWCRTARGHRLRQRARGRGAGAVRPAARRAVSDRYEILRHGGGGAPTSLVCGAVRFDHPAAHHLVALLPAPDPHRGVELARDRLDAEHAALHGGRGAGAAPGGETVITRLADILVIQAIRSWIARDPAAQTGWLGALQDQQIGRAIALIHRDPARPWTVASLAAEVGMSRSAFAARFTELVGEPAMHYVARWRMHVALTLAAARRTRGVGELAGRLGYQSEAAFSRAFKRFIGVSPGAARRGEVAAVAGREVAAVPADRPSWLPVIRRSR